MGQNHENWLARQGQTVTEDAKVEDEVADAETEANLQHKHRAEALDTLATIRLKFMLLHECVYVEKTEVLTWEEALVENGVYRSLYGSTCADISLSSFRIASRVIAFALQAIQEVR
jgi:hypothetical protein